MSFMLLHHYLIEPSPRLIEVIRREVSDAGFADFLLERLLVPKMHMAGHGADDANAMQIKLAYLSMLRGRGDKEVTLLCGNHAGPRSPVLGEKGCAPRQNAAPHPATTNREAR